MTYYWATFRCNFIWLETRPFSASQKVLQVLLADSAHKLWQLYSGLLRELYWCNCTDVLSWTWQHHHRNIIWSENYGWHWTIKNNESYVTGCCCTTIMQIAGWKTKINHFSYDGIQALDQLNFTCGRQCWKVTKWFKYLLCWSMQGDHSPDTLKPWQFFDDSQHSCPR